VKKTQRLSITARVYIDRAAMGKTRLANLCAGWDGYLVRDHENGGSQRPGTVFRINNDGSDYSIIYNSEVDREMEQVPGFLILGGDGAFYGVTIRWCLEFRCGLPPDASGDTQMLSAAPAAAALYRFCLAAWLDPIPACALLRLITWAVITTGTMPVVVFTAS